MAIKILINTIPREEIINSMEAADKAILDARSTAPVGEFAGEERREDLELREALDAAKTIAETCAAPNISDVNFTVGEWRHVSDEWIADNAVDLAKYPYIKEADVVLEEQMQVAIRERGLDSFAQAIKAASDQYGQEVPAIADSVMKIAPRVEMVIE
jgi:hypothetical protein